MRLFWIALCIVMIAFNVRKLRKYPFIIPATYRFCFLLAMWTTLGLSVALRSQYLLYIAGAFLFGAICVLAYEYIPFFQQRRLDKGLKDIQEMLGVTDEDLERMDKEAAEREKERMIKEEEERKYKDEERRWRKELEVVPIRDFLTFSANNSSLISFPTDNGGTLDILPGPTEISFKCYPAPNRPPREDVMSLIAEVRLSDSEGNVWHSQMHTWPDFFDFVDPSEDIETVQGPPPGFIYWDRIPASWRKALHENCIIAGADSLIDSRNGHILQIGEHGYAVLFKYQGPACDIGYDQETGKFTYRVSCLIYQTSTADPKREYENIPPFCFQIDPEEFFFFRNPNAFSSEPIVFRYEEQPRPIFMRTDERGNPQACVKYIATNK
ncbi:MAG: hypothetical protein NTX50_29450 [Candidatus Sumerlaeota bacterium]|nr:hypothetical protein [Candidatus Sumerlaeota bacterium]